MTTPDAVIDEKAASDGGAGVDFDAGEKAADLGHHARHQRHSPSIELMGEAMRQDGVKAGVTEEDLNDTFRGRVFPEDGVDLFPDGSKH